MCEEVSLKSWCGPAEKPSEMYVWGGGVRYTCTGVSQVERKQEGFELTVKLLVPGDEGGPHTLAAVLHQVLKVQFALLVEVLLHFQRAAGVSLRTEAQVLTCGGGGG